MNTALAGIELMYCGLATCHSPWQNTEGKVILLFVSQRFSFVFEVGPEPARKQKELGTDSALAETHGFCMDPSLP